MKALGFVALFAVIAAIVSAGTTSGSGGPVAAPSHSARHHAARHHRRVVHYTGTERLLVDSIDIAAGKAMQAGMSPDGLFERRTSQEWCSMALDAEDTLVRRHSIAWATAVDHATDGESQKFQLAAKACG